MAACPVPATHSEYGLPVNLVLQVVSSSQLGQSQAGMRNDATGWGASFGAQAKASSGQGIQQGPTQGGASLPKALVRHLLRAFP